MEIVLFIAMAAVGALVTSAVILPLTMVLASFRPTSKTALVTTIKSVVASFVVGMAIGAICGALGAPPGTGGILGALASIPVCAYVFGKYIVSPDGAPLGFPRGLVMALVTTIVSVILTVTVNFVATRLGG